MDGFDLGVDCFFPATFVVFLCICDQVLARLGTRTCVAVCCVCVAVSVCVCVIVGVCASVCVRVDQSVFACLCLPVSI